MKHENQAGYIVNKNALPERFPTHKHEPEFWESLGRVVATFGFLEETLSKAIFSFTATRPYEQNEIQQAYTEWLPKLERTLSDPLGNLINTYGKAIRDHSTATIENLDDLIHDLKEASKIRNVICHGSWRPPNSNGASKPFFVNRQKQIFEIEIDCKFFDQVQRHTAEITCEVINTVTHMGWQFPGSNGPGKEIWEKSEKC
jgi:hypothetical protein